MYKFMGICSGLLLSLVNGQMDMKMMMDKKTIDTLSDKKNITVGGQDNLIIEYYTKKRVVEGSEPLEMWHELHGNCYVWGVDVKKWKKNDKLQCQMSYSYGDKADWFVINLDFKGKDKVNEWSCIDGTSANNADFTWDTDKTSNCMANTEKSITSFNGDLGYFRGHWMRAFNTKDEADDVLIQLDSEKPGLKGNFQIIYPGSSFQQKDENIVLMSGAQKMFATAMLAISMMSYVQ